MHVLLIEKIEVSSRNFSIQLRKSTLVVKSQFDMVGPSTDINTQRHPFPYWHRKINEMRNKVSK